jgi:hypothetical protein
VVRWWPAGPVRGHLFLFVVDMTRLMTADLTGTPKMINSPSAQLSMMNRSSTVCNLTNTHSCQTPACLFATCKSLVLLAKKMNVGEHNELHQNGDGASSTSTLLAELYCFSVSMWGYASDEDCSTIGRARRLH